MIARIQGKLIEKQATEIVVDCSGVGYLIRISVNTFEKLPILNEMVTLLIYTNIREDAFELFGFMDNAEREAFKLLKTVSKIGPKSALNILSSASILELREFIVNSDLRSLTKIPGLGKKTAERIIVELKDKFANVEIDGTSQTLLPAEMSMSEEAISALVALGYTRAKSEQFVKFALRETGKDDIKVEKVIRVALRFALA